MLFRVVVGDIFRVAAGRRGVAVADAGARGDLRFGVDGADLFFFGDITVSSSISSSLGSVAGTRPRDFRTGDIPARRSFDLVLGDLI